eukprot:NODE_7440_length_766_cov_119.622084_g7198_i0.p1 GENE.NODE_7440_length_766_cov_119.622084_g7198_i0~~NODE_7440_length_766_cov_119.622084_g7198_i0.p1  ORF type:complete len:201 (-),score=35.38 NODE_7440_length_766_cov_119.622084_g7198_i0:71-673(-)
MALGAHALNLLKEQATHHARGESVPPYNEEGIKQVINQTQQLHSTRQDNLSNPFLELSSKEPYCASNIVTLGAAMLRNKRCGLAYLKQREERVLEAWWKHGLDLPATTRDNMSVDESKFFSDYDKLMSDYISDLGLDLRVDQQPPVAGQMWIRTTKEHGTVPAGDGYDWTIGQDEMMSLSRSTAVELLQKGVAAPLNKHN